MDINEAIVKLQTAEGVSVNCATQEVVTSVKIEDFWFVNIQSTFEDGTVDKMQMNMNRFAGLYAKQAFSDKGVPIEPIDDEDNT